MRLLTVHLEVNQYKHKTETAAVGGEMTRQILCDCKALSEIRWRILGLEFSEEPCFKTEKTRFLLQFWVKVIGQYSEEGRYLSIRTGKSPPKSKNNKTLKHQNELFNMYFTDQVFISRRTKQENLKRRQENQRIFYTMKQKLIFKLEDTERGRIWNNEKYTGEITIFSKSDCVVFSRVVLLAHIFSSGDYLWYKLNGMDIQNMRCYLLYIW